MYNYYQSECPEKRKRFLSGYIKRDLTQSGGLGKGSNQGVVTQAET